MNKPSCCASLEEVIWVDNVPGKEYWYCRECKKEVEAAPEQEPFDETWHIPGGWYDGSYPFSMTYHISKTPSY